MSYDIDRKLIYHKYTMAFPEFLIEESDLEIYLDEFGIILISETCDGETKVISLEKEALAAIKANT